jgi:hypothetical protein
LRLERGVHAASALIHARLAIGCGSGVNAALRASVAARNPKFTCLIPLEFKRTLAHLPPVQYSPLSQDLAHILGADYVTRRITLNEVLEKTEGRGVFLVIILLCLPFVAPVSISGMSTPLGLAIALLAVRQAMNKPPRIPRWLGDRQLSPRVKRAVLGGGLKVLRLVEKGVRPRRTSWMSWPSVQVFNALVVVYAAFLLALPLPPIPPFTNMFPAYAIIFLAASMMEEDGVMVWVGYAATLGTTVYFLACARVIVSHFSKWSHAVLQWLHHLL